MGSYFGGDNSDKLQGKTYYVSFLLFKHGIYTLNNVPMFTASITYLPKMQYHKKISLPDTRCPEGFDT